MTKIAELQTILGVEPDSIWGPKSQAALDALTIGGVGDGDDWHNTTATSFADPADIRAFEKCKQTGKTDKQCFAVGDNAIGLWGDSTRAGTGPSCALPSSAWHEYYSTARKKKVIVEVGGKTAVCELKDTSGSRNVIDLNPDACVLLNLTPPVKQPARWRWA